MTDLYNIFLGFVFVFAITIFVLLFFISAPYGKFLRKGWGPVIKSKWAWLIMEMPAPLLILVFYITSSEKSYISFIFLIIWLSHYIHRTFIYSFLQSGKNKDYPVVVSGMAFVFNCINGFINGFGVFHLTEYESSWMISIPFIIGIILFIAGFIINKTADEKLRHLRRTSPEDYVVPRGWLFDYISCPHYFGEIIEWLGWAVMTWSSCGFAFFMFTVANLFPRAIKSHIWYREKFVDYPVKRKALVPFVI